MIFQMAGTSAYDENEVQVYIIAENLFGTFCPKEPGLGSHLHCLPKRASESPWWFMIAN